MMEVGSRGDQRVEFGSDLSRVRIADSKDETTRR